MSDSAGPTGPTSVLTCGASKTPAIPRLAPLAPLAPHGKASLENVRAALARVFGAPAEAEAEVGGGERKLRASAKVAAPTSPLRDGDALAALFEAEARREATGEPIPRDVAEAFGEAYAAHLEAIRAATAHRHGRRYLETAARFCRDGWAARALALGWGTQALFALHRTHPWERLDALGAAYLAREPVAVTADTIRLASGLTCRPRPCRGGVVL